VSLPHIYSTWLYTQHSNHTAGNIATKKRRWCKWPTHSSISSLILSFSKGENVIRLEGIFLESFLLQAERCYTTHIPMMCEENVIHFFFRGWMDVVCVNTGASLIPFAYFKATGTHTRNGSTNAHTASLLPPTPPLHTLRSLNPADLEAPIAHGNGGAHHSRMLAAITTTFIHSLIKITTSLTISSHSY
jgi:hypothetical protein